MTQTHHLQFPLTEQSARSLHAGDQVFISGVITVTAGLPTHQRIIEHLDQGLSLPPELSAGTLFHLGSYNREIDGRLAVLYLNPTTSTRFNPYMPRLIKVLNLRAVGGKGGLDADSARAMKEVGCVYLSFLGGGCTLLSEAIREIVSVQWTDLIAHYRLVTMRVENLGPTTVGIDAHGRSLYDELVNAAQARLPAIKARLDDQRLLVTKS